MKSKHRARFLKGVLIIMISMKPLFAMADDDEDPVPCPNSQVDGGPGLLLAAGVGNGY